MMEKIAKKLHGSTTRTLKSGLRVANFNSPHAFYFDDDSILNAVQSEFSVSTMLNSQDVETISSCGRYVVVNKQFIMSNTCAKALIRVCKRKDIDIVIVPLPVLLLMKNDATLVGQGVFDALPYSVVMDIRTKIATTFMVDRVNKLVSSIKFCR